MSVSTARSQSLARSRAFIAARPEFAPLVQTIESIRTWPRWAPTSDETVAERVHERARLALEDAERETRAIIQKRFEGARLTGEEDRRAQELSRMIDSSQMRPIGSPSLTRSLTLASIARTHAREAGGRERTEQAKARWLTLHSGVVGPAIQFLATVTASLAHAEELDHAARVLRHELARNIALAASAFDVAVPSGTVDVDLEMLRNGRHIATVTAQLLKDFNAWQLAYCAPESGLSVFGFGLGNVGIAALGSASLILAGSPTMTAGPATLETWQKWVGGVL